MVELRIDRIDRHDLNNGNGTRSLRGREVRRSAGPGCKSKSSGSELGFRPRTSDLQTIIRSAWSWHQKAHPDKATN